MPARARSARTNGPPRVRLVGLLANMTSREPSEVKVNLQSHRERDSLRGRNIDNRINS